MRKALYLTAALLVCSAIVFAQESGSASSSSQSGSQATTQSGSAGASTQTATGQSGSMSGPAIQGCLMGSNGNYTLTDATGSTYQLQGDDSELSSNVNKQVEVMGTPGASASASASEPGSASGDATAGSEAGSAAAQGSSAAQASASKTLNVTSVQKIADICGGASQSPQ